MQLVHMLLLNNAFICICQCWTVLRVYLLPHYLIRFPRIVLGLFGKQLVFCVFLRIYKIEGGSMPNDTSWYNFYGVGVLTGVDLQGLFFGNLAFVENMQYMDGVKIGVNWVIVIHFIWLFFDITYSNKPNK